MDDLVSFGRWMRQRRKALDLTQGALASRVGVATSTIEKLEAEVRRPSQQTAARLAAELAIPADERPAFVGWARGHLPADAVRAGPRAPVQVSHASGHPGNLPLERTSFVGRDGELAAARRLLDANRLVTLTGTGGTGKTRLALRLAAEVAGAYPDGVWVVNLAALHEPSLVPQAVATTLEIRAEGGRSLEDTLLARLRERHLLLLLDNCEHLIAACAGLADAVLQRAPDLRLLATSREALNIAGEAVFVVPPLGLPGPASVTAPEAARSDAVRLFVERASAVRPGFALLPGNAAAVAQICRRLEGIPLALELAAARVRVLTLDQIAERLDDRFELLTGGSRTALLRHQTLQASIDWSYALLSDAEQTLLRRLAPFAGGWTLEAAEAVCSDPGTPSTSVLDLLTRLVDCSLVVVTEHRSVARYRWLETVRQYAVEKLRASGEAAEIHRRHAAYYVALVQAINQDDRQSRHRIKSELDNARAAVRWTLATGEAELGTQLAAALGWVWYHLGDWHEGRRWHQQVRVLFAGAPPTAAYAHNLFCEGFIAQYQGDVETARALFEHSLALFRQLGEMKGSLRPLLHLGRLAREAGDVSRARELYGEVIALADAVQAPRFRGLAQNGLGEVAVHEEDVREATRWLTAALATFQALDMRLGIAFALNVLGHIAQLEGQYARAAALHAQSLPIFGETDRQGVARAHAGWGEAALGAGDTSTARFHFAESLRIFGELSDSAIIWSLAGLAGVAVQRDEAELAARLWGAVEAERERSQRCPAPASRAGYERACTRACDAVGRAAFVAAWAAGRQLSLERAVAEARATLVDAAATATAATQDAGPSDNGSSVRPTRRLTAREVDVLRVVAEGVTDQEVAARLGLRPRTVTTYLTRIYAKLAVGTRTAAVRVARERHLIG